MFQIEGVLSFNGHSVEFRDDRGGRTCVAVSSENGLKAFVAELMRKSSRQLSDAANELAKAPGQ